MVFFPNGLQKTDGSFVEKVEDCEVDMRIEVGIKAEIDDGNDENENIAVSGGKKPRESRSERRCKRPKVGPVG